MLLGLKTEDEVMTVDIEETSVDDDVTDSARLAAVSLSSATSPDLDALATTLSPPLAAAAWPKPEKVLENILAFR